MCVCFLQDMNIEDFAGSGLGIFWVQDVFWLLHPRRAVNYEFSTGPDRSHRTIGPPRH